MKKGYMKILTENVKESISKLGLSHCIAFQRNNNNPNIRRSWWRTAGCYPAKKDTRLTFNIMIMMLLCANRNNLCFLKETSMLEMLSSALLKAHLGNTFFLNYIFVGWLIILSSPVLVLKVSLSIFTQDWSNMFHAVKTAEIFAADRLTHSVSRYICLNSVFE